MATFNFDEVDNYVQNQGEGFKFFKLQDHNWSAKVRFMYGPGELFQGYTVHNISTDARKLKYVPCLREGLNDPLEKCPLCKAQSPLLVQYYIPVYVISITKVINGVSQPEEQVGQAMLFQRGKTFSGSIASAVRQSQGTPLVSNIFNIVRNGKANDMQTTYMVEFLGRDNTTLDQLPERPVALGSYILPEYDFQKMTEIVNGTVADQGVRARTISNQTAYNQNNYAQPTNNFGYTQNAGQANNFNNNTTYIPNSSNVVPF